MPNDAHPAVNDDLPQLSEDMTRADLIEVLSHLPLRRGPCTVQIDRGVATYLVRALKQQH